MIIEVNTELLNIGINLNQLFFLSLVLSKNQINNQDARKIVSLISDEEILDLIDRKLITSIERGNSVTYKETENLNKLLTPKKEYFDVFYDMYPVYVVRPDGSKCYLRANVNKCRHFFDVTTGNSSAFKEHIIKCLEFEIDKKMKEGKLTYMKTMWRWLIDHQWEAVEEEMNDTVKTPDKSYGTELL